MSTQKRIDWNAVADRAARMTDAQLHAARADIVKTLPHARALDRAFGTDDEGYYTDEASVLAAEQAKRPGFDAGRRRVVDPPQTSEGAAGATIDCPVPSCRGRAHAAPELGDSDRLPKRCAACGVAFFVLSQQYWILGGQFSEDYVALQNPKK